MFLAPNLTLKSFFSCAFFYQEFGTKLHFDHMEEKEVMENRFFFVPCVKRLNHKPYSKIVCTAPSKSCVQKIRLLRPTKTLSTCDSAQSLQMLRKYITQRDCLLTCPVLLLGPYSVANYFQSICKLCTESLIKRVFVDIKSQIFRTQLF